MRMRDITEATKASLIYHGTSIPALLDILADARLRGDLGVDEHGPGISFTLSLGVAQRFAPQAEDYFWSDGALPGFGQAEFDKEQPQGAVLVFNQSTLASHTALRRVHWDGVATEREVRSSGDVELAWGLTAIRVRAGDLQTYSSSMAAYPDAFTERQTSTFPVLMRHGLLRRL